MKSKLDKAGWFLLSWDGVEAFLLKVAVSHGPKAPYVQSRCRDKDAACKSMVYREIEKWKWYTPTPRVAGHWILVRRRDGL